MSDPAVGNRAVSTGPGAPLLDVDGPAAPPRANGELVFAEPWEGRAFALAASMQADGLFTWDAFRERLVVRVAEAADADDVYYRCWLAALEDLLVSAGHLDPTDVSALAARLAGRAPGHDHRH